ncbi:cobalt/nickel transport system permease protein [Fontibacillus panacisegetis]|uniref:Cobalt/nickel transport system permease protein n=1 Tax=Fontibacillus panacisegetis TaxID=670482 RepID=A0A1G7UCK1_9BACL|nr:energy-coupling factor ABC transporter permease [Fontibacillus panacisegetis]SDG44480.1 cobalt/nickel transport system permease protein [Fontibacillus panacisegetis]
MHIPDGFLSPAVSTAALAIAITGVGAASWKFKGNRENFIKMGLVGGCIFAAQMLNFPIPGGTSGHFIGAALAAVVLGPSAAVLVMTAILIVQALLFHDGGLFALGANILSMGIIAPLAGASIMAIAKRILPGKSFAIALIPAGIISVLAAALVTAIYLAASGTIPLSTVVPAMLGWHLWIGLIEGGVTLAFIALADRQALYSPTHSITVSGGE